MVFAVVGAGTVAFINADQGPEPVQQYGAVQEGDAAIATGTAIAITLIAAGAGATAGAITCVEGKVICQGDSTAEKQAEKHETRIELISRSATAGQQAEVFLDSMDNGMSGAKSIAREEGMSAYWDAVEEGQSLSAAKQEANNTVDDYYTVKYQQVANSWNLVVNSWAQYSSIAGDSGLQLSFVQSGYYDKAEGTWTYSAYNGASNTTLTAPNGTQVTVTKFGTQGTHPGSSWPYHNYRFGVGLQNGTLGETKGPKMARYKNLTQQIDSQAAEVKAGINTVAEQTYQDAINGEINISEMLSANTIAREFSQEGNDQAWAAVRLSQMKDVGLPANLDGIGNVTVKTDGETTTGVFLSKSNPDSGQFETGTTYNATALDGGQYVVKQSGSWDEITGEFEITEITTPDGGTKDSLTVRNPTYEATNITEWKERMDRLEEMRAEINARQKKLMNNSGGTGDIFPDLGGLPYDGAGVVVVILSLLGMAAVSRSN
jgi:hypothetical protein